MQNNEVIPYSVERTRNRSSRAVLRNGSVIIRLAYGMGRSEEDRHIRILLKKMSASFAREQQRVDIHPFLPIFSGASELQLELPALQKYMTIGIVSSKNKKKLSLLPDGVVLHIPESMQTSALHRSLWAATSAYAARTMETLVHAINRETLKKNVRTVSLKYMRSRWGSCSQSGTIALSTPLLFTTPDIVRYVIVHELAHLKHPNHSQQFWKTVEIHFPAYRAVRAALRGFRLPQPSNLHGDLAGKTTHGVY